MSVRRTLKAVSAAALLAVSIAPAGAADLAAGAPAATPASVSENAVPACDATGIQDAVARRIADADKSYYGGLLIKSADRIVQTGYSVNQPSPYARRYCSAQVVLSNGSTDEAFYAISQNQGFVGVSWNVDVCLAGLDHYRIYDGACRDTKPAPSR